jgi:hypothetical protein
MIDGGPQSPTPEDNSSHDPEKAQTEVAEQILSKVSDKSTLSEIDSVINALKSVVRDLPNLGPEMMEKVRKLLSRQRALKNATSEPQPEPTVEEPVKAKSEPKNEQQSEKARKEAIAREDLHKARAALIAHGERLNKARTFSELIGYQKDGSSKSRIQIIQKLGEYRADLISSSADLANIENFAAAADLSIALKIREDLNKLIGTLGEMCDALIAGRDTVLNKQGSAQAKNEQQANNENIDSKKFINDFMQELRNLSGDRIQLLYKIERSLDKIYDLSPNVPQWFRNLRSQFVGDAQSLRNDPWFGPSLYDFSNLGLEDAKLAKTFSDLFNDVMRSAQEIEQLNMQRSLDAALGLTEITNIQQFSDLETKIPRSNPHLSLHMLREYRQAVQVVKNTVLAINFDESKHLELISALNKYETLGQEFKNTAHLVARVELIRREKEQTLKDIVPQIEAASDINAARKLLIDNGLGDIQDVVLNIMNIFVSQGKEQMRKQQFPNLSNVSPSAIRDMWYEIKDHRLKRALQTHFDAYAKEVFANWMETRQKSIAKEKEALFTSLNLTLSAQIERKLSVSDEDAGLLPKQQLETVRANLLTKYSAEIDKISAEIKFEELALDQLERWVEESSKYKEMTLTALSQVKIGNYALEQALGKIFISLRDEVESFRRSVSFMTDEVGQTNQTEFLANNRAGLTEVKKETQLKLQAVLLTRLMAQRVDHPVFAERRRVATAYGVEQPAYMMYPSKLGASDWGKIVEAAIENVSKIWGIDITQVTESSKDILLPKIHESLIQLLESAVDRENFAPDHVFRSTEEIKTPDKPIIHTYGTPLERNLIAGLKGDRFEWDMPQTGTPERKSKELEELINQGTISFRLTQGLLPARIEYLAQQTLYRSQLDLSLPIRELLSPEDVEQFRQQLGKKDSRTVQSELIELIRNSPLLKKKQQEINKFVSEQITLALRNPSDYLQKVCGYPHDTGLSGIDWYNLFYTLVEGKFGVETVQPGMFKEYIPGLKREDLEKAYAYGKDLRATAGTNS